MTCGVVNLRPAAGLISQASTEEVIEMELHGINDHTTLTFEAKRATNISDMSQEIAHARDVVRHRLIEAAAYRRAAERNFAPGHALEDWLAAEQEVLSSICEEL